MNKLYIEINESDQSYNPPKEQFGEWSRYLNCSVNKISTDGESLDIHRQDIDIDFEPESGQIIYLVEVTYSSGDTFGTCYGNLAIAGAFQERHKAEACEREIHNKEGKFVREAYHPWTGYFERIQDININRYIIG